MARKKFLSTPSSQRATGRRHAETIRFRRISIHALFAEGDRIYRNLLPLLYLFLSTPSSQRATGIAHVTAPQAKFLSTPSSQRATRPVGAFLCPAPISIHALFAEGDL